MTRRRLVGGAVVCLWGAVICGVGGCGGGTDFGESVTLTQKQQVRASSVLGRGQTLRLPAQATFNVATARRFSEGSASAKAGAQDSGTAFARVHAENGGHGWAEFELGQVIFYDQEQPSDVTVTFKVEYADQTACEDDMAVVPKEKCALKVFIMDSQRHVLKRLMLVDLVPEKGPTTWKGTESPAFDVTLQPHLSYHLVLAGRVEAESADNQTVSAEIEVRALEIVVTPRE